METTISPLKPVTLETAPEGSRPALEKVKASMGMVPNLMATFANAPAALNGYLALDAEYNKGTLSPADRQLILLAASLENECGYCKAAHTMILRRMIKLDEAIVEAVRENRPTGDAKVDALVTLVRQIVGTRGRPAREALDAFYAAGYTPAQVEEVLLGIALKTISNYTDHIFPVEIDAAFANDR